MHARLFAAAILTACAAAPASATVPDPPPRICTELEDADAVFIGDVLSERREEVTEANIDHAFSWRVRVIERFKGSLPRIVTVHTSATSAREELDVGRRHIIFAFRAHSGRLNISGGGNTRGVSGPVITEIRRLVANPPLEATIAGQVVSYREGFLAGEGPLRLRFTDGRGRAVHGRADSEGRFRQTLPAGVWSVRVAAQGWVSRRGDYSYGETDDIRLTRGGCADVQLLAIPPRGRR